MLDSDVQNADSMLSVEFYDRQGADVPYVRIQVPGNNLNVRDRPATEADKMKFSRQWIHYQMKNTDASAIGTPISQWNADAPDQLNQGQMMELQVLRFVTVEQIAMASDAQLQRIGMGGVGLREKARSYLANKNRSDSSKELEQTRSELETLKAQMAQLIASQTEEAPRRGRPPKEVVNG